MSIVRLTLAFLVVDLLFVSGFFGGGGGVGCGHFNEGTVVVPRNQPGGEPRTVAYSAGFCHYMARLPFGPSEWSVILGWETPPDIEETDWLDEREAIRALVVADIMEKQLVPRFGEAAEAARAQFLEHGGGVIRQPSPHAWLGTAIFYGVPPVQLATIGILWSRRRRGAPVNSKPSPSGSPAD